MLPLGKVLAVVIRRLSPRNSKDYAITIIVLFYNALHIQEEKMVNFLTLKGRDLVVS